MTFREFWQPLRSVYPEEEARWIGRLVFEVRYGLSQADLLMGRETTIEEAELLELQWRLLTGEPVQYVLGEAPFGEHLFMVSPAVLIPRPETLWLCQAVVNHLTIDHSPSILDIGTGSGCIAITIALATDEHGMNSSKVRVSPCESVAKITAWDISTDALAIARANAERLKADVTFEQQDILAPPDDTDRWDVIVSNPPYICEQEKAAMEHNVLDFEPQLALFVPDDDPLLFYRAIGRYAFKALKPSGQLFLELNENYAHATKELLHGMGFADITINKDTYGKDRFIRASRTH